MNMNMKLLLLLIAALACSVDAGRGGGHGKHGGGGGGCRGRGNHPGGRHGHHFNGYTGQWEHHGNGNMPNPNNGAGVNATQDMHERYLNSTLLPAEAQWEDEGEEGPSTAAAVQLMTDCLASIDSDDVHREECATEYEWVKQCIACENDGVDHNLIAAIVASSALALVILGGAIYCKRSASKRRARASPTVTEFEPGSKPTTPAVV